MFVNGIVWRGGPETGETLPLQNTGYTSPRKKEKPKEKPQYDRLRWFDVERGYGFTAAGVFVHSNEIAEGIPVAGAAVDYERQDGAKGPRAINVKVVG